MTTNIKPTHGCLNLPWTSWSSSVRSMTEPLGLVAAGLPLEGVDPAAWLSNKRGAKKKKTLIRPNGATFNNFNHHFCQREVFYTALVLP